MIMDKKTKNLLVFGYGLAVILSFIAFKSWRSHGVGMLHVVLLIAIPFLVFVTKFRHDLLLFIYDRWMQVANFIGGVITGLILSILFYSVFGVIGIVLRLMKKDLLDREIDPRAKSYWIKREIIKFRKDHYTRQF